MIPLPLLEEFVGAPEGEKGSRRRAIRGREIGRLSLAEALKRTSRKESD
jgi:hypothetical protein